MTKGEKLIKLIAENPTLEIVPMVDHELIGDDYGYWKGNFGEVKVDDYYCSDERIYFLSEDEDELREKIGEDLYTEEMKEWSDENIDILVEDEFKKILWKRAIVVKIHA